MNASPGQALTDRRRERGGARLNFLIVILIVGVLAYIGYQLIPVYYQAYLFKDTMQVNVDKAAAANWPPDQLKAQLQADGKELNVPPGAGMSVERVNGRIQARVTFKRPVVFPGYTYDYTFDHTVKSATLFSGQ